MRRPAHGRVADPFLFLVWFLSPRNAARENRRKEPIQIKKRGSRLSKAPRGAYTRECGEAYGLGAAVVRIIG